MNNIYYKQFYRKNKQIQIIKKYLDTELIEGILQKYESIL